MKRFNLLALGIFFALPAAAGLFDAWCYVLVGKTILVDWTGGRAWLAWFLLIPAGPAFFIAWVWE